MSTRENVRLIARAPLRCSFSYFLLKHMFRVFEKLMLKEEVSFEHSEHITQSRQFELVYLLTD